MPDDALAMLPLEPKKQALLCELMNGLDRDHLLWLSGYLAGVAREPASVNSGGAASVVVPEPVASAPVTVIYGSQTGHARGIAESLARQLNATGISARIFGAGGYPNRELKDERLLIVIMSTHGDGDPPDDARGWIEFLNGRRAPRLELLRYAVLALGDSSYPQFCHTGRAVDARMEMLGASRLLPVAEADVDFETIALPWASAVLAKARARGGASSCSSVSASVSQSVSETSTQWSRLNPFAAELYVNQRITGRESERDVRHIEMLIDGSEMCYQPGDSVGIWPTQDDRVVEEVLSLTGLDGGADVALSGETLPLFQWLKQRRELTVLTRPFLGAHAERAKAPALNEMLNAAKPHGLSHILAEWQLPDLLRHYPGPWSPADLVTALRPLTPRLYSIASSPLLSNGEEVHLTVGIVDYLYEHHHRWGVASHHTAGCALGEALPIFIEANDRFRLPKAGNTDIVMIGPGTGIAPFRAFVQHRAALGDRGRNWLFFGNRHFRSEFLYQLEWQEALAKGQLDKLDLAFSRDGGKRAYVQDRMREASFELYKWVEGGAFVYVCGDAKAMARDVDTTLVEIAQKEGKRSAEDARAWLSSLSRDGRYLRDVY